MSCNFFHYLQYYFKNWPRFFKQLASIPWVDLFPLNGEGSTSFNIPAFVSRNNKKVKIYNTILLVMIFVCHIYASSIGCLLKISYKHRDPIISTHENQYYRFKTWK